LHSFWPGIKMFMLAALNNKSAIRIVRCSAQGVKAWQFR